MVGKKRTEEDSCYEDSLGSRNLRVYRRMTNIKLMRRLRCIRVGEELEVRTRSDREGIRCGRRIVPYSTRRIVPYSTSNSFLVPSATVTVIHEWNVNGWGVEDE